MGCLESTGGSHAGSWRGSPASATDGLDRAAARRAVNSECSTESMVLRDSSSVVSLFAHSIPQSHADRESTMPSYQTVGSVENASKKNLPLPPPASHDSRDRALDATSMVRRLVTGQICGSLIILVIRHVSQEVCLVTATEQTESRSRGARGSTQLQNWGRSGPAKDSRPRSDQESTRNDCLRRRLTLQGPRRIGMRLARRSRQKAEAPALEATRPLRSPCPEARIARQDLRARTNLQSVSPMTME